MKTRFFLAIFLPIFSIAQQQSEVPATVIFKQGIREHGTIRYKAWVNNPAYMIYTGADSVPEIIEPQDVTEIHIEGKDVYIGAFVARYMNPLETNSLGYYDTEPEVQEHIFLRQLVNGDRLDLYVFRETLKTHYFIADSSGKIQTLHFVRYLQDNNGLISMVEKKGYQDQLGKYLKDTDTKGKKMAADLGWNDRNMIAFVTHLNNQLGKSYAATELEKNKKDQRIFAGAAAALVHYTFSSVDPYIDAMSFTSSVNPQVYAGYRFSGLRRASWFSLQFVAGYYSYKTTGTSYRTYQDQQNVKEQLEIDNSLLNFSLDALYAPVKTQKITWELGLSFQFLYTLRMETVRTTTAVGIYGNPIYVEPVYLGKNQRINWGIISQCLWKSGHSIRFVFRPYQETSDFGGARPRDQVISLGYHYNFRL
jgi:hypothetical protein